MLSLNVACLLNFFSSTCLYGFGFSNMCEYLTRSFVLHHGVRGTLLNKRTHIPVGRELDHTSGYNFSLDSIS